MKPAEIHDERFSLKPTAIHGERFSLKRKERNVCCDGENCGKWFTGNAVGHFVNFKTTLRPSYREAARMGGLGCAVVLRFMLDEPLGLQRFRGQRWLGLHPPG